MGPIRLDIPKLVDRRSGQCEDRNPERAVDIVHSLRIGAEYRFGETTATKHDLLIVAKIVTRSDKSLFHRAEATDRDRAT